MRFYLSAGFHHKMEMETIRHQLESIGHSVVSRWHRPGANVTPHGDLQDVAASDVLVQFCNCAGPNSMVEFGMALGFGLGIVIVGDEEKTFFYQLAHERYKTWDEAFRMIQAWNTEVDKLAGNS